MSDITTIDHIVRQQERIAQLKGTVEDCYKYMAEQKARIITKDDRIAQLEAELAVLKANGEECCEWEYFCDSSYYGYWAVRPVGENRWGHCFHLVSEEEAKELCEVLNQKKVEVVE